MYGLLYRLCRHMLVAAAIPSGHCISGAGITPGRGQHGYQRLLVEAALSIMSIAVFMAGYMLQ